MAEGIERAGVDVEIALQLDRGDLQALVLQELGQAGGEDPLAQAAHHRAHDDHVLGLALLIAARAAAEKLALRRTIADLRKQFFAIRHHNSNPYKKNDFNLSLHPHPFDATLKVATGPRNLAAKLSKSLVNTPLRVNKPVAFVARKEPATKGISSESGVRPVFARPELHYVKVRETEELRSVLELTWSDIDEPVRYEPWLPIMYFRGSPTKRISVLYPSRRR